jgi:hypothetical protein
MKKSLGVVLGLLMGGPEYRLHAVGRKAMNRLFDRHRARTQIGQKIRFSSLLDQAGM